MPNQGQALALLLQAYAGYRETYLEWAKNSLTKGEVTLIAYYQRALVAWYEATTRAPQPYRGQTADFIRAIARYYDDPQGTRQASEHSVPLDSETRPLEYIPQAISLTGRQNQLLVLFRQMGAACRDLLLMVHYHRISLDRIAEVKDLADGRSEVANQLRTCELMARESWQAMGIIQVDRLPSPTDEELLTGYLNGTLDTTERWAFEARLPGDGILREALELRRDWQSALLVAGRQDLIEILQREEKDLQARERAVATPPAVKQAPAAALAAEAQLSPRRRWYDDLRTPGLPTVLAILLVAALTLLLWNTFGGGAPTQQAEVHFQPFPNLFLTTPPQSTDERDLERILLDYDRGDYRSAYEELLPVADAYPAARLYLANSALALGDPARALDWLERVPPTDPYRPPADWYEALAYLALDRPVAARTTLQSILETPGHPERERAELLLRKID